MPSGWHGHRFATGGPLPVVVRCAPAPTASATVGLAARAPRRRPTQTGAPGALPSGVGSQLHRARAHIYCLRPKSGGLIMSGDRTALQTTQHDVSLVSSDMVKDSLPEVTE